MARRLEGKSLEAITFVNPPLSILLDEVPYLPFPFPKNSEESDPLLKAFLLEKAIYELDYELNTRPDWAVIPSMGIKHLPEF
jgi:hypothetical protein